MRGYRLSRLNGPLRQGSKTQNREKRVSESTNPFPPVPEKGVSSQKVPISLQAGQSALPRGTNVTLANRALPTLKTLSSQIKDYPQCKNLMYCKKGSVYKLPAGWFINRTQGEFINCCLFIKFRGLLCGNPTERGESLILNF